MLEIAKIRVDGIFADVVERSPITANLVGGCIRVEYAPGIWDGLTKTVVFKGVTTKDVITNESVIEIPPETIAAPSKYLQVGFFGVDAQRKLIIPTLWANLGYLQPGADPSGDTSTDPTLPVWAQLADQIKRLEESGVVVDPEEIKKIVDEYLEQNPPSSGGGVDFEIDSTLKLENGILSVNTIDKVIEDDTRPITSGAVYNEFSMAVALLKTI